MSEGKVTLVVLRVLDDTDDRDWWEALGLPDPHRWNQGVDVPVDSTVRAFPPHDSAYVSVELEEEVKP